MLTNERLWKRLWQGVCGPLGSRYLTAEGAEGVACVLVTGLAVIDNAGTAGTPARRYQELLTICADLLRLFGAKLHAKRAGERGTLLVQLLAGVRQLVEWHRADQGQPHVWAD